MSSTPDPHQPPRWLYVGAIIAAVGVLALLLFSVFLVQAPSVRPDELGFLLNGQVLSGSNEIPFGEAFLSFYPAGFGFFTAAAAVIGGTISAQFRISLLFNVAFTITMVWVLVQLARRHFGTEKRWAFVIAVTVAAGPALAANSLFAWSESLSRLCFAAVVLLIYETASRPNVRLILATGALAAYLPIVHARFTLVLPFVWVALIVFGLSKDKRRAVTCTAGILTSMVTYFVLSRANVLLRRELYPGSGGQEGRKIDKFLNLDNASGITRGFIGQSWYLVATALGILVVGVFVLSGDAWDGVRSRIRERFVPPLFAVGAAFLVVLTSALQLVKIIRPDHLVYGRYAEAIAPVFVVAGFSALVRSRRHAMSVWAIGIALGAALMAAMSLAAGRDELRAMITDGKFFALPNAIGLDIPRRFLDPMGYLKVAAYFVVLGIVAFLAWRRRSSLGVAVVLVVAVASTTYTTTRTIIPYRDYTDSITLDNVILEMTEKDSKVVVGIDTDGVGGQTFYDYRYLLHPIQVRRIGIAETEPTDVNCLITGPNQPRDANLWESVAVDGHRGLLLWKRHGLDSC